MVCQKFNKAQSPGCVPILLSPHPASEMLVPSPTSSCPLAVS